MTSFDWAYFRRLNMAIAATIMVSVPALALVHPLFSAAVLAAIAWFLPDLDRRFRLNNPAYLDRFSSLERERHDERNKGSTRWAFAFLAVGQLMRALSGQWSPGFVPWYVMASALAFGVLLINSLEFLRYRLAQSSETYEQLHNNHLSLSRLLVTPLIIVMFMAVHWLVRS